MVKPYLDKAVAGLKAVQANPTIQQIEERFPAAAHLAARVIGVLPGAAEVINDIDLVARYGPLLLEFSEVAGIKPMEWGAPNDPEAEARLRERDALTGG